MKRIRTRMERIRRREKWLTPRVTRNGKGVRKTTSESVNGKQQNIIRIG